MREAQMVRAENSLFGKLYVVHPRLTGVTGGERWVIVTRPRQPGERMKHVMTFLDLECTTACDRFTDLRYEMSEADAREIFAELGFSVDLTNSSTWGARYRDTPIVSVGR